MRLERHRARRHPFHASIELTDLESETQTKAQTGDLSLFGCRVDALNPLPAETKVRIKISNRSENFEALGKVVYSRQNEGWASTSLILSRTASWFWISGSLSEETCKNNVRVKCFNFESDPETADEPRLANASIQTSRRDGRCKLKISKRGSTFRQM